MRAIWSGVEISCFFFLMSLFSGVLCDRESTRPLLTDYHDAHGCRLMSQFSNDAHKFVPLYSKERQGGKYGRRDWQKMQENADNMQKLGQKMR